MRRKAQRVFCLCLCRALLVDVAVGLLALLLVSLQVRETLLVQLDVVLAILCLQLRMTLVFPVEIGRLVRSCHGEDRAHPWFGYRHSICRVCRCNLYPSCTSRLRKRCSLLLCVHLLLFGFLVVARIAFGCVSLSALGVIAMLQLDRFVRVGSCQVDSYRSCHSFPSSWRNDLWFCLSLYRGLILCRNLFVPSFVLLVGRRKLLVLRQSILEQVHLYCVLPLQVVDSVVVRNLVASLRMTVRFHSAPCHDFVHCP